MQEIMVNYNQLWCRYEAYTRHSLWYNTHSNLHRNFSIPVYHFLHFIKYL